MTSEAEVKVAVSKDSPRASSSNSKLSKYVPSIADAIRVPKSLKLGSFSSIAYENEVAVKASFWANPAVANRHEKQNSATLMNRTFPLDVRGPDPNFAFSLTTERSALHLGVRADSVTSLSLRAPTGCNSTEEFNFHLLSKLRLEPSFASTCIRMHKSICEAFDLLREKGSLKRDAPSSA